MSMVQITPPPLSAQSMADLFCTIILLCRSTDHHGKKNWAYLCVKPSMAEAFKEARDKSSFKMENYGTILESGDGHDVPPEVMKRMERDYGVNHHYEADLLNTIEAIKKKKAGGG